MPCITELISKVGNTLETLRLKRRSRKHILISDPFNLKTGPAVNFPGYSEEDISLMREKAIASTAIADDADFELSTRVQRPMSRASSHGCGLSSRVCYHARRVSKGRVNIN